MEGQTPRRDYDQALKRMLARGHDDFLALVAPGLRWRGERSSELPAAPRRADLVWEVVTPDGQDGLLHVELQTEVEANIGERLAEYAIRLWRRDHVPIRSLVVFLREATVIPASPFVILWNGEESLRYSYDRVQLWEIPYEQVLEGDRYALWPLVSLMRGATVQTTLAVAERLAVAPLPRSERSELTGLLGVLAGVRLPLEEVAAALRRNPMIGDLIQETGWADLWRREGREQGREEGREQGSLEGQRRMVRLVLEARFGALNDEVMAAVNRADEAVLEAVVRHSATDTWEQVRSRLGPG